ncbi:hypothetical protein [Nonomuraea sp. C10]|uniref:hypothetical protein n=1 Tax=Nonomuraea sp. C10 TaxID=2600577 RepID=UPI0011CDEBD9|nr:hypothetical protein [Nonomuraea sp. C10]TXK34240.1 hypothetical protein FR742_33145 [Nonomuraea sp. C10]
MSLAVGLVAVLTTMNLRGVRESGVEESVAPARVFTMVVVPRMDAATMRALGYARALRADHVEAVTVANDREDAQDLLRRWDTSSINVPLKVLDSPYRELTRPITAYVRSLVRKSPRD